jgi:hypothetical protein
MIKRALPGGLSSVDDTHIWKIHEVNGFTLSRIHQCTVCGIKVSTRYSTNSFTREETLAEAIRRMGVSPNCNIQLVRNVQDS